MKEMNRTYYLVWKRTVAKREQREKLYEDYIFSEEYEVEEMYKTQTKLTVDEMVKLNRAYLFKMHRFRLILMVIYELFLLWVCLSAFDLHWILIGVFFLFLVIFIPVFWYLMLVANSKKYFKSNKAAQYSILNYTFEEDKIVIETERGSSFIKYDEVYKVYETKTNFYLFISNNQAYVIVKENCSDELTQFIKDMFRKAK